MISQDLSQFALHARAILGLPIPNIHFHGASASSVILAEGESTQLEFNGLDQALLEKIRKCVYLEKQKSVASAAWVFVLPEITMLKWLRKKRLMRPKLLRLFFDSTSLKVINITPI